MLDAQHMRQIDRVLHDVALFLEGRIDVDRGIGDEQRLRVVRHFEDEDVADPPLGVQPGCRTDDRAQQLVGVQAPFISARDLAGAAIATARAAAAWLCGGR